MNAIRNLSAFATLMLTLFCAACLETKTPYDSSDFRWGVIHADRLLLLIEGSKGVYTRGYTGSGFMNNSELRYYAIEYKWPLDADGSNPAQGITLLYENHGQHLKPFSRERLLNLLEVDDAHALNHSVEAADKEILELLSIEAIDLFATDAKNDSRYLLLRNGTIIQWNTKIQIDEDGIAIQESKLNPTTRTKWLVDSNELVFFHKPVGIKSPPNIRFFPDRITVWNYDKGEQNIFTLEIIGADELNKVSVQ